MSHDEHHEHLIKELTEQFEPVFSKSSQGVIIYLDDEHKACNQKLASMLGYGSVEEWVANQEPVSDVVEEDQDKVIQAYVNASDNFVASTVSARFTRKDGTQIKGSMTMSPVTYKGEVFVIEFLTEEKG